MCGYKLGILRSVLDDSGIAEEIVFGVGNGKTSQPETEEPRIPVGDRFWPVMGKR